ncbi:MAG TPA: BrnA antitoxin family protein [bacterium]|nr:BrnA antitoxin family protein [bacterium]
MKKEYDFSKARVHRGPILASKGIKIQKTFRLDESVYHWLVQEGKKQGIPYQTLMNSILKRSMSENSSLEERVRKIEDKLGLKKTG